MKNIIALLLILSSASAFSAEKVGTIKTLEVSFAKSGDYDTAVSIKGTVVGYACQQAFTHPVLSLIEQDVDLFTYGITFEPNGFGVSLIVCLDKSTVVRPFEASLTLDTDYTLYNSFISGVEDQSSETSSSLQAMKEAATCAYPTIPALAGGFFGPGPVMQEVCTFTIGK